MADAHREVEAGCIEEEFRSAKLGDQRRSARLVRLAAACASAPGQSLPSALRQPSALKAGYRFLSHDAVTPGAMLEPHFAQTAQRMAAVSTVVVAHDTTEFEWSTDRQGLGRLRNDDHGFLAHVSLAMTGDAARRPLGVVGLHTWTRHGEPRRKTLSKTARRKLPDKESERWLNQVGAVQRRFHRDDLALIHVMDREADAYPLLNAMSEANHRFVVRLARDRTAREDESAVEERVSALTTRTELVFDVQVQLSTRPEKATLPRKSLMPRDARKARLAISTTRMQIKKPPYVRDAPPWLDLNVVCVREIDVPDGMHPVEWTLLTTEPVDTLEQVCAIVEYYRARWLIEELFKAIKTGCEYEKLQLESYDALVNALAMFLPIAWRMLLLRNLERSEPGAPAALVVSPDELEVLRIFGPTLSQSPSVRDVLLAVASLGGYIKHKIRPGWLVLARGFEKLTLLQRGFAAARR
jgi:hypothetical protein